MPPVLPEFKLNHALTLKTILVTHFILTSLVLIGFWVPLSYLFVNVIFLIALFWAQSLNDGDSIAALLLTLQFQAFCMLMDILIMGTRYPSRISRVTIDEFSLAMAIINLLLRPVTGFIMYVIRHQRYKTKFATHAPSPPTVQVTTSTVKVPAPLGQPV